DAPHQIDFDSLKMQPYDEPALKALFVELEFDALGKRVFGPTFSANAARAAVATQQRETAIQARLFDEPIEARSSMDVAHDYRIARTAAERAKLIKTLLGQPAICMSIVPSSMQFRDALPLGIAFCFAPHSADYVVFPDNPDDALQMLEELRPV